MLFHLTVVDANTMDHSSGDNLVKCDNIVVLCLQLSFPSSMTYSYDHFTVVDATVNERNMDGDANNGETIVAKCAAAFSCEVANTL
jgi:hypothetical protein